MENFKINFIKEKEFLLYLDWITRFNNPLENYSRVVNKILCKNCVEPKFNTNKLDRMNLIDKIPIAKYVWDMSLMNLKLYSDSSDFKLEKFLLYEEQETFNDEFLYKQIKNTAVNNDFSSYFDFRKKSVLRISELVSFFYRDSEKPYFLNRLMHKKKSNLSNEDLFYSIDDFASIKVLFLVEGITEEKLFPSFAKQIEFDFDKYGIKLKAAGGKSQILKYYAKVRQLFKIPIFILLDADGVDIIDDLKCLLLPKDSCYLISDGEIEDVLSKELIIKALNNFYSTQSQVQENDFIKECSMTKNLSNIYKEKGFGVFHKAKFAQILQDNIETFADVGSEIIKILNMIRKIRNA